MKTPKGFVVIPSTGRCWCESDDADTCTIAPHSLVRHEFGNRGSGSFSGSFSGSGTLGGLAEDWDACDRDNYIAGSGYERFDFVAAPTTSTATPKPSTSTPAPTTFVTTSTEQTPPVDVDFKQNVGADKNGNFDASLAVQGTDMESQPAAAATASSIVGVLIAVMVIAVVAVVVVVRQKKHGTAAIDNADVMESKLESGKTQAASTKGCTMNGGGADGSCAPNTAADYAEFPTTAGLVAAVDYLEPVNTEELYGAANAVEEDIYDSCTTNSDAAAAAAVAVPIAPQPMYEEAAAYRASVDMSATLAAMPAIAANVEHDYVLAAEVGAAADVCYDVADTNEALSESAPPTPWLASFEEPVYALGAANLDDNESFRMTKAFE